MNFNKSKNEKPDKRVIKNIKEKQRGGDNKRPPKKDPIKTFITWLLVGVTVFFGIRLLEQQGNFREIEVPYSSFKILLMESKVNIKEAEIVQTGINKAELHGKVDNPSSLERLPGVENPTQSTQFIVNLPFLDSQMLAQWDKAGFNYTFKEEKLNMFDLLLGPLPWIVIMVLFWFFMLRQMNSGQRGIFSFGKSKAKMQPMDRPQNTFEDVAGVEEAKAELVEIIDFLKDPDKFKKLGGKIPKGVLLLGPPGTGKTLLGRCVAGEAGVPFFSMSGSHFVEMFVGVGASRVRDLFDNAKKESPCIIFIDEIDAVGRQRGAGLGGGHDEREQTLNQILVEMDGFEENSGVILIAATNRPDVLDPALLRPGRFDRQVVVDVPDIKGREGILKVHAKDIPLADDVYLYTIARGTPGFVGADLRNLVNEAALLAAKFGQDKVKMLDFEEAKDKVMMGVERKSLVLSDKEKRNTAFHEAGHAICNYFCKEADPLHKVTIIPRGRALGVTFSLPGEDKHSYTKQYMFDRICIMMGGRTAEEIVFGTQTTGASNDIKQATDLARRIVCDFGMTEELGPLNYGSKDEQIFLGREFNRQKDYSENTAEKIDHLMRDIISTQLYRARKILRENRDKLESLANALLEHELLDRGEIVKVVNGERLDNVKKTRTPPARRKKSMTDDNVTEKKKEGSAQEASKDLNSVRENVDRKDTGEDENKKDKKGPDNS